MINKEILKQMGFGKGDNPGDKESWYHDSGCWVYFNSDEQTVLDNFYGNNSLRVNGKLESMRNFFKLFLKNYENDILNSCRIIKGYNE